MIKAVVLLLIIIPTLGMILFSKAKKYSFVRGALQGENHKELQDILQLKKEYQKFPSQKLNALLQTKTLTLKERLIIEEILKSR